MDSKQKKVDVTKKGKSNIAAAKPDAKPDAKPTKADVKVDAKVDVRQEDNINVDINDIDLTSIDFGTESQQEPQGENLEQMVEDCYNHKKYRATYENTNKYKDIDEVLDMSDLDKHRTERRIFSEKLEKDPEFREKYINDLKKQYESNADEQDMHDNLWGADTPAPSTEFTQGKYGVHIANVTNLTINITL